ncbi:MAG: Receptor family ligand-binding protein [Parcubacteria group bacterium GW2011_GWC2_45_7]|nr:MAG: Receptor family ligand-binding protein [Parcubacteria group bacterium GW2011_GWC2_45_7]KKU73076.1 MAG: Receptor family ligand-binding protein [Parcubacteria group bacterium GW2011_GWA2_47_26]
MLRQKAGAPTAPATTEPIKIGLVAPMTGEGASYGEAAFGGAMLAVKEINDAGGINGRKVELIVEDDRCSSAGANAINKLVNVDKVTAIVGPVCSSSAGPGVPIAQSAGTPVILIGASAPDLTKVGDYIFRNYPSDALQGKFAADFVYNTLGKRKTAVIFVKNDWGQGIRNVFIERYKQLGGEIVYDEGVLQDATDLRTQITKAKAANPEVLYFPVYPQNGVAGLKQIKQLGLTATVVGGDAFIEESILKLPEAEGVLIMEGKTNNPDDFQAKVKQVSNKSINIITPYAYDAVKIFAKVIEKVGTDQKAIRDELARTVYRYSIAVPVVEFDANGDLKVAEVAVKVIQGGKTVEYIR